jgi:hypothetical protein
MVAPAKTSGVRYRLISIYLVIVFSLSGRMTWQGRRPFFLAGAAVSGQVVVGVVPRLSRGGFAAGQALSRRPASGNQINDVKEL